MGPKNAKAGASKQKPKEEERDETLQAVVSLQETLTRVHIINMPGQVLADSYERRFTPFTLERPRVSIRSIELLP